MEHFLEIVYLQQAEAESIYSALIECLKKKSLQVVKIVGMGFDGTATFLGKKSGVQASMKNLYPMLCALPLPYVAVGLRSSCEFNTWN